MAEPGALAFWRNDATERFISLEIFFSCILTEAAQPVGCYKTAALTAFTGRALTTFRAGFALNIIGSFVNGLMPLRSFV